jgi:hypothetical protein
MKRLCRNGFLGSGRRFFCDKPAEFSSNSGYYSYGSRYAHELREFDEKGFFVIPNLFGEKDVKMLQKVSRDALKEKNISKRDNGIHSFPMHEVNNLQRKY